MTKNQLLKIVCVLLLSLTFAACTSQEVKTIKESHMDMCPEKTVGQMVAGFFGSPSWSSGISKGNEEIGIPDGVTLVNVKGKITYNDKPVTAVLQFVFSEDGDEYEFYVQALEMNEIPQDELMITGLLEKMCEE